MKKNSDTRNGRYESPFRPSDGRRIWSRTPRIAISPRFCMPRGTSLGERNATQKNPITTSAARMARSIGLVKSNEPMVNIGFHSKSCRPGAGNPHPLKMWQPPLASAFTSPVTGHLLLGSSRYRRPLLSVAVDDETDRDAQSNQHADWEEQRHVDSAPDQPTDEAIGGHPGKQVAEHGPADIQALGPAVGRGLSPADLSACCVALAAHVTGLAPPLAARAPHTAS